MVCADVSEERELSGVPDGKGGVLPTIKQPITPGNQMLAFPGTGQRRFTVSSMDEKSSALPPPLVTQVPSTNSYGMSRQTSQTSNILTAVRPVRQVNMHTHTHTYCCTCQTSFPYMCCS